MFLFKENSLQKYVLNYSLYTLIQIVLLIEINILLKKDLFYWLDATDSTVENSYIWNSYTGSPGYTSDTTIIPWCTNQPDGGINENCLALAPMDWCLVDLPCTSAKLYAVCQFKN